MTKISIWVQSEAGRYRPGMAIVRIDGEVHAKLLGEEGFEIEVSPPQVSGSLRKPPPVELSGAAAERAEEILDRRLPEWHENDPHGPHELAPICGECDGVLPPYPRGYSRPFCQRPDHWEKQGVEPPADYDGSGMYTMPKQPPRPSESSEASESVGTRTGRFEASKPNLSQPQPHPQGGPGEDD